MAAVSSDGIHVWSMTTPQEVIFLPCVGCGAIRFDHSGQYLFAWGASGLCRWHLQTKSGNLEAGPAQMFRGQAGPGHIYDLCLSPDDRSLLLNVGRRAMHIDLSHDHAEKELGQHRYLDRMAWSGNGRWVAGGTWQGEGVKVWDVERFTVVKEIPGDRPGATSAYPIFSPDSRCLVVCGQKEYRFFNCADWSLTRVLPRSSLNTGPGILAFQNKGNLIALTDSPDKVLLFDQDSLQMQAVLESDPNLTIVELRFDGADAHLAVGTAQNGIQWWDLRDLRGELTRMGLDWGS
jgi:WD40 repeat protein